MLAKLRVLRENMAIIPFLVCLVWFSNKLNPYPGSGLLCWGSAGSAGSACFWALSIRIH
jgi:hypothetical protein